MKADLHNHLRTRSRFNKEDFNKAIDLACERMGKYSAIGVVNFSDERYEQFVTLQGYEREYLGERENSIYIPEKKILVIKGQEVPTKEGHLLVLGLGNEVHLKEKRSLEDTIKEAKDNNGIIIADHPFYWKGIGPYLERNIHLLERIDGIEIFNGEASFGLPFGPLPTNSNERTKEFYKEVNPIFPRLGAISTSDGHSFYELGKSWTELGKIELSQSRRFIQSLRESIQRTSLETERKETNGTIGTIDHIIQLGFAVFVAPKIGLGRLFQTKDLNQRLTR